VVNATTHTQPVAECTIAHACSIEDQVIRGTMLNKGPHSVCQLPLLVNLYRSRRGTLVVMASVLGICSTKYMLGGMGNEHIVLIRVAYLSLTETSTATHWFPKEMAGIW
jgi:hypothetical protein